MTTPGLVPAVEKEAALVTNESITRQAVIVSRKMKKPCIIGIKIATLVFKNGDIVETDSDGGTIKIIK